MAQSYLAMDPGEEVLFTARRHWVNILPVLVSTVLLILLDAYALGWVLANTDKLGGLPAGAVATLLLALGGVAALIAIAAYLIFRQNRVTLTNRHYIQITQSGLFNRTVSKLTLDEIQDCEGKRKGFFATMLGYGEILIETAGEEENFDFGPIRDPLNVAEAINDAHQKYGRRSESNLNPNPPVAAPEVTPSNPPPMPPPATPDSANGVDPDASA